MAWSAEKYANSELNGSELASYAEEFEVCHRSYSFREMGSKGECSTMLYCLPRGSTSACPVFTQRVRALLRSV